MLSQFLWPVNNGEFRNEIGGGAAVSLGLGDCFGHKAPFSERESERYDVVT